MIPVDRHRLAMGETGTAGRVVRRLCFGYTYCQFDSPESVDEASEAEISAIVWGAMTNGLLGGK
jgi:hypothetical protein